jgi:hypothetical protein
MYFVCPSSGCQVTPEPLLQQVQNPVWLFGADNNGTVIQFPAVPAGGLVSTTGTLTFGIGTQSDNALGAAKVQQTDFAGNFTTIFNGQSYSSSFIDSGSNGYFFLDAATSGIPVCQDATDFYCPPSLRSLSATTRGTNGTTAAVTFSIGNLDALNGRFAAFSEVGGPNPGQFNWGLPFFYGRTVFTAIESQTTPAGAGPYWAY